MLITLMVHAIIRASFDRGYIRFAMRCLVFLGYLLAFVAVCVAPPKRAWTENQLFTYYFMISFGVLPVSDDTRAMRL
jgi:hypothetical protein